MLSWHYLIEVMYTRLGVSREVKPKSYVLEKKLYQSGSHFIMYINITYYLVRDLVEVLSFLGLREFNWINSFFNLFFIILLYWGYIVAFTKVLTICHWIHPLHHFLPPPPIQGNSFNRSHFSIFIYENNTYIIYNIYI
jgi:hypothetical protein